MKPTIKGLQATIEYMQQQLRDRTAMVDDLIEANKTINWQRAMIERLVETLHAGAKEGVFPRRTP